jgi:glycosyltransferase involved in cell wall biosynthesis
MLPAPERYDIVMIGTFAAWRLGTLQARILPLAVELRRRGIRCAIVTTPWDLPSERGVRDIVDGVPLYNTPSVAPHAAPLAIRQQLAIVRQLNPRAVHVVKPKGFGGFTGNFLDRSVSLLVDSDDWEGDGGWNRAGTYGLLQRRVFDWQERTLLKSATGVTAASTLLAHRAQFLRSARPDSAVWLLRNGITRQWYEQLSAARSSASGGDRQCGNVVLYSRFAEFGSDWLPRFAAALDRRADGPVRLDVVGTNGDNWRAGARVDVRMHGYLERDALPSILARADVAVYPYERSLITLSKQSVKLLELMAAGTAIIASDVGDVARVLGGTGILVGDADPEAFAETTARLLASPERVTSLGDAARRRVAERFLIESSIATRLVAVYRDVGVLPE